MNLKKAMAVIIAASIACSALTACSSKVKNTGATTTPTVVSQVTDKDDNIKVSVVEDVESNTLELKDKEGNTLTVVPIYDIDGKTIIAGYVQSAKDKNGKELNQKSFPYIKTVIAVSRSAEGKDEIVFDSKNKPTIIKALSDKNGYIIAMQDSIDVDKDKDTEEYFKVLSKLDGNKNLFIRLEKDSKNKRINVKVTESKDKTTVTDEKGNKVSATDSKDAQNIKDLTDKAKEEAKKPSGTITTKKPSTTKKAGGTTSTTKPTTTEKQLDYTAIVLKKNGKVDISDNSNVTISGSAAEGGTEVKIEGPGKHSKYYVTSETDSFLGQLEFDLRVGDDVEIKLNDVNISTQRKTAIKLVNLDSEDEKENDSEETGSGLGQSGSSVASSAPEVQLSFTGTNYIKANGSGKNGSIYSECKLAIKGHGKAVIDGGQSLSGICSTESITIKNATLDITSNSKQGISCDKKLTINSGATINIKAKGDGIHCNRFVMDGVDNDGIAKDSKVTVSSLYTTECADGIDADEEITIEGGRLEVTALTDGKSALKVRKIEKGNPKGIFDISGGTVIASGSYCTKPLSASQKVVYSAYTKATKFEIDGFKSADGAKAFLCSPVSSNSVTNSEGKAATISWKGNIGSTLKWK